MVKAVVFDWAGTIIDYGCIAPVAAFVEAFKSVDIEISISDARRPMGLQKIDHIREILSYENINSQWLEKYGKEPNEDDIKMIYDLMEPKLLSIIKKYSEPIIGAVDIFDKLRSKGIKIGSTTGYLSSMMNEAVPAAKSNGLEPDAIVNSSEVPQGRPAPWMCFLNAMRLNVFPMWEMVKVGDTVADIEEGKNAGMWTVGVTKSGNEVGLNESEIKRIDQKELDYLLEKASKKLINAGAHFVINGIWDFMPVIEEINNRLLKNERP